MPAHSEQVPDCIVEWEKLLCLLCRFEFTHLSFPLARRLMWDFGSIIGVPIHNVSHIAEHPSHSRRVASQFVSNDLQWFGTLATQESSKESLCRTLITMRLNQNIEDVAILIHGTPEILLLAIDSNKDLIQIPVVAEPSLSSLQFPGIVRTELLTPLSNRLIRDDDSTFGEKILDISETHAEAMVGPDRIADNLARETIAGVTRRIAFHETSFSGFVPELTMPLAVLNPRAGWLSLEIPCLHLLEILDQNKITPSFIHLAVQDWTAVRRHRHSGWYFADRHNLTRLAIGEVVKVDRGPALRIR
jgi:hypothetical protein